MMTIKIKRVYEPPSPSDGQRILVDRLWPRGIAKASAKIDLWIKEIAPSNALRKWYAHDPQKWPEFKRKYFAELETNGEVLKSFLAQISKGEVTFLFSSKEMHLNNALALKEYVEQHHKTNTRKK
jgi:uncharacterized protein YeaO (DUF488 family)